MPLTVHFPQFSPVLVETSASPSFPSSLQLTYKWWHHRCRGWSCQCRLLASRHRHHTDQSIHCAILKTTSPQPLFSSDFSQNLKLTLCTSCASAEFLPPGTLDGIGPAKLSIHFAILKITSGTLLSSIFHPFFSKLLAPTET